MNTELAKLVNIMFKGKKARADKVAKELMKVLPSLNVQNGQDLIEEVLVKMFDLGFVSGAEAVCDHLEHQQRCCLCHQRYER